jgi:hypothetical protein
MFLFITNHTRCMMLNSKGRNNSFFCWRFKRIHIIPSFLFKQLFSVVFFFFFRKSIIYILKEFFCLLFVFIQSFFLKIRKIHDWKFPIYFEGVFFAYQNSFIDDFDSGEGKRSVLSNFFHLFHSSFLIYWVWLLGFYLVVLFFFFLDFMLYISWIVWVASAYIWKGLYSSGIIPFLYLGCLLCVCSISQVKSYFTYYFSSGFISYSFYVMSGYIILV